MFKQLKLQLASRRVKEGKKMNKKTVTKKKTTFWTKVWNFITLPFRALWAWLRTIDLIGLVNLTLLVAIIVLFSMLIIDLCGCNKKTIILVASDEVSVTDKSAQPVVTKPTAPQKVAVTLPLKKVAPVVNKANNTIVVNNEVRTCNTQHGDVIIDGEIPGTKILHCAKIDGSVYLQNMRKYTLPCGVTIEGDLFIRDVGMLQFCGEFTVTGNIYVTRRSSFGPIPKTARVGGQIIL